MSTERPAMDPYSSGMMAAIRTIIELAKANSPEFAMITISAGDQGWEALVSLSPKFMEDILDGKV